MSDLEAGSRFDGHYVIEAVAGRGGMGVVYRARDEELDRTVALKVAAARLAELPELQEGLRREARLAARVEHPSVVAVHSVGAVDGRPYVALQWLEGSDLRTRLALGPPPVSEAMAIVEQLASGLDAAHAAGCLHRDVKPSNVLVRDTPQGPRASLTDFGVAGALQDAGTRAAPGAAAELVGTPAYLAPELVQGAAGDQRSDLYGLACVAFEVLTGTAPFQAESVPAMLVAHAVRPRPAASARRPGLPPAVDPVLARAMAIDPAERPASGAELVAELQRALVLGPGGAPAPGLRAAYRRRMTALEARPRLRAAVVAGTVAASALVALAVGAGAHEALTTPPVSNEPRLAAVAAPKPPKDVFVKHDPLAPAGSEGRAEAYALLQDLLLVNRKQDIKTFFQIGGPSDAQFYGAGYKCRPKDRSLPPGLTLPKATGFDTGNQMQALQKWLWKNDRAPVKWIGMTPKSLRVLEVAPGVERIGWRGAYEDAKGRRREMTLITGQETPRFRWKITLYDYCPDTPNE